MAKLIIQSVDRALEILRLVASEQSGTGLQSLAKQMNLRAQTVHNLANTLVARGFLRVLDKPVRYALGPELYNLTQTNASNNMNLRCETAARTVSAEFPSATVTTCRYNGSELTVTMRIASNTGLVERPVNRSFAPYTSASCVAFAAFAPSRTWEEYERLHPFDEYGTTLWKSRQQLDDALAEARRRGLAILTHNGLRMALPVYDQGNDLHSLLGISLSHEQVEKLDAEGLIERAKFVAQWVRTEEPPEMLKETQQCS